MSGVHPLVTCIMPTYNRRCFVPHAIEYFLRQDYQDSELLIVDDGTDPVSDLVPEDPRVRYVALPSRATVGAKRNTACEQAAGDIIVHWDDDDWHARGRLSTQVNALSSGDVDACGLSRLLFYEPMGRRVWEYRYPDDRPRWVAGGTLCYRRELWKRSPFPEVHNGEDSWFVRNLPPSRVLPLADNRFYVATIHVRNTAVRAVAEPAFVPSPREAVESLLGGDVAAVAAACRGAALPLPYPAPQTTVKS
jgi:glycosyltransferase involved in cell wall biosynthesis